MDLGLDSTAEAMGVGSLDTLIELVPHPTIIFDARGQCVHVNGAWQSFTGYDAQDSVAEGWLQAVAVDDRARVAAACCANCGREQTWASTLRLFERRTTDVVFHWVMKPHRTSEGEILAWVGTFTPCMSQSSDAGQAVATGLDSASVNTLKHEHARLKQVHRLLEEAQRVSQTGSWSFDLVKNEVWWSPVLFDIVRLPVSDLAPPYATHNLLFTPESWGRLEPAVARAASEGTSFELELELAPNDDERRYALARGRALRDKEGSVVRLVGTFQDISSMVRLRHERDQVMERLALATGAVGIGVWEWSPDSDSLIWDRKMHQLYGVSNTAQVSFSTWYDSVLEEDVQRTDDLLKAVVAGRRREFRNVFRIRHPHLGVRHISAMARMVRQGEGPAKMVGLNWDVTDEVRLEAELRRAQNLESLGVLAGGVAHDFNNLLTGILAHLEIAQYRLHAPEKLATLLKGATDATMQAKQLTRQLMAFAKGDAAVFSSVNVADVLLETIAFSLRGAPIDHQVLIDPSLPDTHGDIGQLKQVISNLTLNARDAMREGQCLLVKAETVIIPADAPLPLDAGRYIRLVFQDRGHGIPPEHLERVFEPYFTTKTKGTGLGLSVVYSIVVKHQGHLHVESELNIGTCVTVYLPAVDRPLSPDAATPESLLRGAGEHLLLMDDDPMVRDMLHQMLELLGYRVTAVAHGQQAMDAFDEALTAQQPHALALLDMTVVGGKGGVTTATALRARMPTLPVVLISGYSDQMLELEQRKELYTQFLAKPILLQDLARVLHHALGSVDTGYKRGVLTKLAV